MAYFVPSYLQKRLLRYILTRIDFIDTEEIDLDNLGVRIGQRSVIELRNVGIKVGRLTESLHLPDTITLRQASVKLLRATVPADLHVSGIEIEVEGVEVSVGLASTAHDATSNTPPPTPSKRDVTNRPRIPSTITHDPGGVPTDMPGGMRSSTMFDVQQQIPSSEDLAASFLQTESATEKADLQRVIESQSQHIRESYMSSSVDGEAGLGMPGGFSLPGFVANFFQGVADRLSVVIKDVAILVDLPGVRKAGANSNDDGQKFMIKVDGIKLQGNSSSGAVTNQGPQRVVKISGMQFCLLSEMASLSPASSRGSPRTDRFTTKLSSTPGRERTLPLEDSILNSPLENLRSFSSTSAQGETSASMHSDSASVQAESPLLSASHLPSAAMDNSTRSSLDNRVHAEHSQSTPPRERLVRSGYAEDLTESKLFSHQEAESMYMSVVSDGGDHGMPGSWDSAPRETYQSETLHIASLPSRSQTGSLPVSGGSTDEEVEVRSDYQTPKAASPPHDSPGPVESESNQTTGYPFRAQIARLVCVTILTVTEITARIPQIRPNTEDCAGQDPSQQITSPNRHFGGTYPSSRTVPLRGITRDAANPGAVEIAIGCVEINLDIHVGKTLVRTGQEMIRIFPNQAKSESQAASNGSVPTLNATLAAFDLKLWESVDPETPDELFGHRSTVAESVQLSRTAMLCLSLRQIEYQQTSAPQTTKRLLVSKLNVYHHQQDVLSCMDKINIRDSIASSSILRPHDIAVVDAAGRIDVQIKPLRLTLDLSIIDDVLGRSGGLSSILELGNSIVSPNLAPRHSPTVSDATQSRRRSVRFTSPQRRSPAESSSNPTSTPIKIDFRLSGLLVELVQGDTSLRLRSSAIKTVCRQDQIRVAVDGAVIEGPIFAKSRSPPELNIKLRDIRCHYLYVPEESDLDRLLSLLSPSNNKYDKDDDIMVETLLRQRTKGAVLRLSVADLQIGIRGLDWVTPLTKISDDLAKLSTVAEYLPEDDRPGILTFGLIDKLQVELQVDDAFGPVILQADLVEGAHISIPSLSSAQISTWTLSRGGMDSIIGEITPQSKSVMAPPMLMCRFIADEMEPTVRVKLFNTSLEYKVPTLVDVLSLVDRLTTRQQKLGQSSPKAKLSPTSSNASDMSVLARKIKFSVVFKDSGISLYPSKLPSKAIFLLTDAVILHATTKNGTGTNVELKKASLLVINDKSNLGQDLGNPIHQLYFDQSDQVQTLSQIGYVPIGYISSAACDVLVENPPTVPVQQVDVEVRNNLIYLETCADSTQTLMQVLGALAPPTPPSTATKFRTQVVPIEDMLASFTGDAFVTNPGPERGLQASQLLSSVGDTDDDEDDGDEFEDENDGFTHYLDSDEESDDNGDELTASYVESHAADSTPRASVQAAPTSLTINEQDLAHSVMAHSTLDFRSDHFNATSSVEGTAHRWDSTRNTYGLNSDSVLSRVPLKVKLRDVHVIWNLFDGYDWQSTRDIITQAVKNIETKATARRHRAVTRFASPNEDEEESEIGDFLFNSIYIGIPANRDPRELANAINHDIDDLASETGSYATRTTAAVSPTRRQSGLRPKKLRLQRSKQHKITFELEGLSADVVTFPADSGEVESSVDIRVKKLEIFDHVPTSTWKKFATYMHDAGEREVDTSQIHIELLNVKPVAELAASEIVLKVTLLPLRLHIDQDALDFMTRFFEFKDESAPTSAAPSNPPFIQRAEISPIRLRLDFKPKRVDYGGLRSGRTTEFMNFFVLDRADMVLRRVIVYGVSGFDHLGIMLNNIWSPDVKRNQLPTVLAGLAPLRPFVDVSSGLRELVAVPIREYRKDGRIVRSIQKGAIAFAKTSATELVNLGAKMAIGTQQVLQNAEAMLVPSSQPSNDEADEDLKKQISLYADQPVGIVQGLRGAYASLEQDLLLAKDAIIAVPGEIMATGSATGAAKVILKQSPTIILRPAIGASKAVGQTLLGAGNTLDRANLRRIEEKYKRH